MPAAGPVLSAGWLAGPWLFPGLLALVCLGEFTAVKLRQGDAVEELTLYDDARLPRLHQVADVAPSVVTAGEGQDRAVALSRHSSSSES